MRNKMYGKAVVEMQNTHSRFLQCYMLNQMDGVTEALFADNDEIVFSAPQRGIYAKGRAAVEAALRKMQQDRMAAEYNDYYFMNCPGFQATEEKTVSRAVWDSFAYRVYAEKALYFVSHFDAAFISEDGKRKYQELIWNDLISFKPWPLQKDADLAPCWDLSEFHGPLAFGGHTSADDFVQIQKLQDRFSHDNRKDIMTLYAEREDIEFELPHLIPERVVGREHVRRAFEMLEQKEKENGLYLAVPYQTAPLIEVEENGEKAAAMYPTLCFSVQGAAFGNPVEGPCPVVLYLGRMNVRYVKENGKWRIHRMRYELMEAFSPFHYTKPESWYQRVTEQPCKWKYGCDSMGGTHAEDVFEIESLIPQWTYRLRRGGQTEFLHKYMICKYRDTYSLFKGGNPVKVQGIEAIEERYHRTLDITKSVSMPSFHTGATPLVEVNDKGDYAKAVWLDHGLSDMGGGKAKTDRMRPYSFYLGKYEHEFAKEDGEWKLFGVHWESLLGFPPIEYDTEDHFGWFDLNNLREFPLPFEKYED